MKRCIPVFGNLCFLFAVVLTSCGTGIKDDHPEHFEHFFTRLNTTSGQTKRLVFDSLDIAIHQLPAGVGDKARYYWAKGLYYMEGSRYDLTFAYFDSLELTIRGRTDEERFRDLHWNSLLTRSKCYENLGNYEAGLKTLLASKMVLLPGDKCGNFSVDSRTAIMLYQQERFLLAAHYFLKMYANAPVCHSGEKLFLTRQGSLDNAGLCYAAVGMLDSAMYYYNATLNYLTQSEREFPAKKSFIELARGIVYGNMADVKARQLDFEAAEALSFASIKAVKKEDANFTSTTQLNLANAYIAWNKLDKAHAILFELDSSRAFEKRDIAMVQKRMAWNLSMKKLFEKAGNLPEAYSYNNQYLAIRDSLDMIRKRDISRDIGTAFENMEQRAINERLETSNREKSFQLAIALLTAVLAIAIGLFVWYNLRRSSKHVKQLQKLNTQVQEKNNDLMQAYNSLEISHAENTRMTRMVAHDLKNPISGIRTLVYTLLQRNQPEELHKMLELIYSTCSNSIDVINDLLKEKGSLADTKKEMVDLRRLLKYCVDLLHTKSEEKKQELRFVAKKAIVIRASREKIWRVMSNLISNAIKFSPEHSTIDIALERKEKTVLLSVKDQGIGIPETLRDKIFTRSAETLRTGTAGEESYGLGLFISRQIVEEHKGKIWFESEEHKGSTFYVELPIGN